MNDHNDPTTRPAARRPLVRTYHQQLQAAPAEAFPLICPVREGEWLEGWTERSELIWSASGLAEPGCVFRTTEDGWPETIWIITDHDPDRGVVAFARVTAGLAASTLRYEVRPSADAGSSVRIQYAVVPISREGETYVAERYDRRNLQAAVVWDERSMNHYLRTGRQLRRSDLGTTTVARAVRPDRTDKKDKRDKE